MVVDGESTGECWLFDVAVSLLFPPPPPPTLIKLIVFDDELPIVEPLDVKWCWTGVELELPEHGFPSFTNTGTATRRGELDDCWDLRERFVNYSNIASCEACCRLPDCVGFAQPSPSPSPVACTCSGDFETRFSPVTKEAKIENCLIDVSDIKGRSNKRFPAHRRCRWNNRMNATTNSNQIDD